MLPVLLPGISWMPGRPRLFKWFGKGRQSVAASRSTSAANGAGKLSLADVMAEADRLQAGSDHEGMAKLLIPQAARFPKEVPLLAQLGFALYMQARYREAVHFLDRALTSNPDHPGALKFMVGALLGAGENVQGVAFAKRAISFGAADEQIYNALGAMQLNLGNVDDAIEAFERAVKLNPDDTQALANLEAVKLRFSALRSGDGDSIEVALIREERIANLCAQLRDGSLTIEQAERLSQMIDVKRRYWPVALELVEKFGQRTDLTAILAVNLSATCFYAGRNEMALALSETAWRLDPVRPETRNAFGSRLVREGGRRWNEGWRLMAETNRLLIPNNHIADSTQWTGQAIGSAKLFVHFDQGVGDAFIALRLLRFLADRAIKVVLWVPPSIAELVTSLQPVCEIVSSEHMPHPAAVGCRYACGLFDLLAGLALSPQDIGRFDRLSVDPDRIERWRPQIRNGSSPVLALIASGNPRRGDDWIRSVPPAALQPLANIDAVTWVNLATDTRPEIESTLQMLSMIDPTEEIKDFADTAAILSLVDAVVAIDCAGAHLAAALGKPLWVLKPTMEDWRWQIGNTLSPWWPDARVFASTEAGEWQQPVIALSSNLRGYLEAR